jgi:NAD(P)-dependent dehydrogenase (short-subunit alcohol dehydrogenase family)
MPGNDTSMGLKVIVFGGQGAIGSAIAEHFKQNAWEVTSVQRGAVTGSDIGAVRWQPLDAADQEGLNAVLAAGPFDAACWAQGANCNDSIHSFYAAVHEDLYRANVLYVLNSMNALVRHNALRKPARLCIVSSIWQNLARQNKLSYCVTKAALQGLVLSAANDLGRDGHLVNAVLPGVLDTPMTRRNLRPEQVAQVAGSTQFERLPTVADVAAAVLALCAPTNTAVTAQFINVDLGYSHVRVI